MAAYTMQLREIIEHYTQYDKNLKQKERLKKGIEAMFKEIDYPIFSESYRDTFQENFVRYFYFREIGFETEYQFLFRLESWLKLNMPYFNKLFETESIKYDPLTNIDVKVQQDVNRENTTDNTMTSTGEKTGHVDSRGNSITDANDSTTNEQETNTKNSGTSKVTASSDGTSSNKNTSSSDSTDINFDKKLYEDTPDGRLSITDGLESSSIEYATNITEDKGKRTNKTTGTSNDNGTTHDESIQNGQTSDTGNVTTDGTTSGKQHSETDTTASHDSKENSVDKIVGNVFGTGNENLVNRKTGKDGTQTYQSMILELRETFIRIEKDIFEEMNRELFMLIY